jgi:predicted metallo-beta-lactamase superfamily hydrolase
MMITIGQTYTTKSGMTVTIEHDKGDHYYPFYGKIMQANGLVHRIAYYTYDGKYVRGADSKNDLII